MIAAALPTTLDCTVLEQVFERSADVVRRFISMILLVRCKFLTRSRRCVFAPLPRRSSNICNLNYIYKGKIIITGGVFR